MDHHPCGDGHRIFYRSGGACGLCTDEAGGGADRRGGFRKCHEAEPFHRRGGVHRPGYDQGSHRDLGAVVSDPGVWAGPDPYLFRAKDLYGHCL